MINIYGKITKANIKKLRALLKEHDVEYEDYRCKDGSIEIYAYVWNFNSLSDYEKIWQCLTPHEGNMISSDNLDNDTRAVVITCDKDLDARITEYNIAESADDELKYFDDHDDAITLASKIFRILFE